MPKQKKYEARRYPVPTEESERFAMLHKLLDAFHSGLTRYTEKGIQDIATSEFNAQRGRYEKAERELQECMDLPPVEADTEEDRQELERDRAEFKKQLERYRDVEARLFFGVTVRRMHQLSHEIITTKAGGRDVFLYQDPQDEEQRASLGNIYQELYGTAMTLSRYVPRDKAQPDIDMVIMERFGEFGKPALCCISTVDSSGKVTPPLMSIEMIYDNRYHTIEKAMKCIDETGDVVMALTQKFVDEHLRFIGRSKGETLLSQVNAWSEAAIERVQLARNDADYRSVERKIMTTLEELRDFKETFLKPIEKTKREVFYQEEHSGRNVARNTQRVMENVKREMDWEFIEEGLNLIWDMAFMRVARNVSLDKYKEEAKWREQGQEVGLSR